MKLSQLFETPIPDEWDKSVFNERIPFTQRVKYAKERATQIGTGSSRIAFVIKYNGRDTVLKVAKNKKGIAQNEYESSMLEDYLLSDYKILIPLIDYDEENNSPTWIHTELATKAKQSDFKRKYGHSLDDIIDFVELYTGKGSRFRYSRGQSAEETFPEIDPEDPLIDGLIFLVGNYDFEASDLRRVANWGLYKGNLVIIDVGSSREVIKTYYR